MAAVISRNSSSAWTNHSFTGDPDRFRILAVTPLEHPDETLARAIVKYRGAAAIDIGRNSERWHDLFSRLKKIQSPYLGIRVPDHVAIDINAIPADVSFVVITAERELTRWIERFATIVQVVSTEEASDALSAGAAGLIIKGQESGGLAGAESSYILLQRILQLRTSTQVPVWCQGGMGLHTAAGVVAGGAFGVVLDSQLALIAESTLSPDIKAALDTMDGSESRVLGGYNVYSRPDLPVAAYGALEPEATRALLGCDSLQQVLCVGQDAALARAISRQCPNVEVLLNSFRASIAAHIQQAQALQSLAADSPLARAHGTRYPIAQGPMTRVSDVSAFACAVAENGALPFLALSLMAAGSARELLEQTCARMGPKSWGVGVLGFAPTAILQPHLELIKEFRPSAVLLAGGRPSQARALLDDGIPTYLHVPSPGTLKLFLKDGMRHFVFEGRECGGHVGPRYSFVLWEQQIELLLEFEHPQELRILFAGGIHDERSAAMVATLAAPLAARGAKIGVLMGTAYITTQEAVQSGAIVAEFQQQAMAGSQTALIETAPGHAIRCLGTAVIEHFSAEKQRLHATGVDQKQIWEELEKFNIGRLRIASKGLERRSAELVSIDTASQREAGLYMIGQAAALRRQVQSIQALHESVSTGAMDYLATCPLPALKGSGGESIAIVGMECVFPGSPDLESFWANILAGRDLVTEVPAARWSTELYYTDSGAPIQGKTPSKWGGFIDAVAFDPLEYGIPPQALAAIEPVQLLSLEVAHRALTDAGYGDHQRVLDREKVSVIFGAESGMDLSNAYSFRNLFPQFFGALPPELNAALPQLTEDSFPGILANVIAGRIANRLGLGGVNYTVDAACASSLTAVELAVKELRAGTSDMVLAGGADLHNSINDFLMFASVHALSPSGRCRSFDDKADGICLGEGIGVVVLKRLSDAKQDGDRIYAVIDGIAGSSDGKALGLTAPRKEGQKRALERAYWQAGVLPASVGLVEAHGTGTVVGDRTELKTLTEIFNAGGALPRQVGLGSVKSQIGHTKCAAGIAGLIKVSKALYHRVLPPTQNIDKPNAWYVAATSPFLLNKTARPWLQTRPRAAASAFGFGGTNFHAVLSANDDAQPASGLPQWPAELFVFRGVDLAMAQGLQARLLQFLDTSDAPLSLRDVSYSVERASAGAIQCSFVARDLPELKAKLAAASSGVAREDIYCRGGPQGRVAFVFPGQGSQRPGMLRDLFVAFPRLHEILQHGAPWLDILYPQTAYSAEQLEVQQQAITDTRVAQPLLGIVESAVATLLQQCGVVPDMLAGHSYGELSALAVAGCFDLSTLMLLSRERGAAIFAAVGPDPGKMAAVSRGYLELAEALRSHPEIVLANQNSPTQTVISGPTQALDAALIDLKRQGIAAQPLAVSCAFHSPVVASAATTFGRVLREIAVASPAVDVYSNTTAQRYPSAGEAVKSYLAEHVARPVRFVEQIEQMYADGARVFVEVGPGSTLSGFVNKILLGKPHRAIATDRKGQAGLPQLLDALAQLAVGISSFDPAVLYQGRAARELDLTKPKTLPATSWMIDGFQAVPLRGDLPAHASRPLGRPLTLALGNHPVVVNAVGTEESAVVAFLNNMNAMANAQRDVMLDYLGQRSMVGEPTGSRRTVDVPAPAAAALTAPVVTEPSVTTRTVRDPEELLLGIVSARTGYPAEMLDLDLDLEADLSIDSIKRVEIVGELVQSLELGQRLGANADSLLEQLTTKKTLRSILSWLTSQLPTAVQVAAEAVIPAANQPIDTKQLLLSIVCAHTGYPEESLDMELDLEADLSIDSIKRMEIVGELTGRLGFAESLANRDSAMERLAGLKTLGAIVEWVGRQKTNGQPGSGAERSQPPIDADIGGGGAIELVRLARYLPRSVDAPAAVISNNEFLDKHFLITDDGAGIATQLAKRLQTHGAAVRIIDFSPAQALPGDLEQVDGLIHLWSLNPSNHVHDVKRFFALVQATLLHKVAHLLVASGFGGDFGHYKENHPPVSNSISQGAGLAGIVKTIVKEFPDLKVHWVDLDPRDTADKLAAYLELELLGENDLTEVAYRGGIRRRIEMVRSDFAKGRDIGNLNLDRESVVLLTGGARGITAQIAVELARRYHCCLELVGRTPLPTSGQADEVYTAQDLRGLRQEIIRLHPEMKPAAVEKRCARILAVREIHDTLAEINAAGGRANYTEVDVRDSAAFGTFIAELYQRYGRIDGVIHGAGVIEDKLLRHKSIESFQRVFDTKVLGAMVLHELIRDDVRFVVFFSSVAGAFGNTGQVDYASANDVLDRLAHAWQSRVPGRVLSVNWGPWAGTGMVSVELEREYSRKGIGLIPPQAGIAALLEELQYGSRGDAQVALMCGSLQHIDVLRNTRALTGEA